MAIEYYSSIDLNQNELQNAVIQSAGSDPSSPSPVAGQIYYNSGDNTLRFHNGTSFKTVNVTGADITSVQDGNGLTGGADSGAVTLTVGAGNGITVNTNDVAVTAAQTTITSVLNSSLVIGRDADNDIDFGTDNNIIFRAGAADQIVLKDGVLEPVTDDDVDLGSTNKQFKNGFFDGTVEADAITIGGTNILTGGLVTSLGIISQAHVSITSDQANDPTITIENTANDVNGARVLLLKDKGAAGADGDEVGEVIFAGDNDAQEQTNYAKIRGLISDASDGSEGGKFEIRVATHDGELQPGLTITDGSEEDELDVILGSGANSTVTIPGNLTVTGTTTTNNVETVTTSSGVIFEGTAADGNDATLKSVVAGSDKTYTLPNVTGHVALFAADPSTTAISSTPTELNLLDAGTAGSSVTLATGDSLIIGDASASNASKKVLMSDVLALFSSNLTSVGALVEGSIAPGFGAIDNSGDGTNVSAGAATIKTDTLTATVAIIPDASDGATLGSATKEWSDLYLADGAQILFGDDQEVRITHNADKGLTFSHEASGASTPFILTLESEEDDVRNDDVISGIEFKSGDSSGGDSVLPAVGIFAVAADTFGTTINRSKLVFSVASTETAGLTSGGIDFTADMTLNHSGDLTIPGELDAATGDFSSSVDIAGDLTLSAGGDGALVFGNAGENSIKIPDNQASALIIEQANNAYMTFKTTNSSELITANKPFNINSTFQLGGTSVTATAAELNIMDGDTSATSTTIVDADRVVVNDNGTMKQVTVAQMSTYYQAEGAAARMVVADIVVNDLTDSNIATITHSLGTADVLVQVYDKTTEANVMCDIARTQDDFSTADTNKVSIDFGTVPPNDCRVLITSLANAASGSVAYT